LVTGLVCETIVELRRSVESEIIERIAFNVVKIGGAAWCIRVCFVAMIGHAVGDEGIIDIPGIGRT
jgi:hypothetical protein